MNPTARMSTREIANYLARQQAQGWPGSRSIHSRLITPARQTRGGSGD